MTSRSPLAPFLALLAPVVLTSRQKDHPNISTAEVHDISAHLSGRGQGTTGLIAVTVWAIPLAGLSIKRTNYLLHVFISF